MKIGKTVKSIIRGFHHYEILTSLECAVDPKRNDVINNAVACLVVELSL